ncbi:MAG: hypothetical protein ABSE51_03725 [Terracidiphilus sp.]
MRASIFWHCESIVSRLPRHILYSLPALCAMTFSINLLSQQATVAIDFFPIATNSDASAVTMEERLLAICPASSMTAGSLINTNGDPEPPEAERQSGPDTPAPQKEPNDQRAPQTKRILGIIPNFRAVSTDVKLPAQSVKEKFLTATEDSFDYSSIFIPAMLAGYSMEMDATPEFHQGAAGYGRYFWHAATDQTSENYMVEFIAPVITHEDTRFYTLGRGGFLKRTGYALSRAAITRSDSGTEVFNASEVIGAGAAAGLSSLYYPSRERSFANTGTEWGLDVGIDAASFVFKEFWPDINHRLFNGNKQPTSGSADLGHKNR